MYGLVLLVALGADNSAAPNNSNDLPSPRAYHEINRDLRAALRREATASSKQERATAIHELTEIYIELKRDPRLTESETLTSYKNKLWGRLTNIKKDLKREFAREERGNESQESNLQADATTAGLADSLSLVGYSTGGPAHLLSQVRGSTGGGAIPDYGPGLVALIERTIAPEFWDVVGGPGTIVYYAPLRVLVVRATSDVHHDIGGVLGGIRAAGM